MDGDKIVRWFDFLLLLLCPHDKPDKIINIWIIIVLMLVNCILLSAFIYMFINYPNNVRVWLIGISALLFPIGVMGIVYELRRKEK